MEILLNIAIFAVTIGLLVTIHEYGHFYIARRSGVMVERFSIGFGKRLFSFYDRHGTEFTLSAIPLGGYVKMLDENAGPVAEHQKSQAFSQKSVGARAAIIAAGPIANFLLAFVLFWLAAILGTETRKAVVIDVTPNSLAASADIPKGYWIVKINGQDAQSVLQANQVLKAISLDSSVKVLDVTLAPLNSEQNSELDTITRTINIKNWEYDPTMTLPLQSLGIQIPEPPLIINTVLEDSPAERAGLQQNDEITQVNGEPVVSPNQFTQLIRYRPDDKLYLGVLRSGELKNIAIIPATKVINTSTGEQKIGFIGVEFVNNLGKDDYMMINRYNPLQAVFVAGEQFKRIVYAIVTFFKEAFTGKASMQDVAGPVGIAKAASNSFAVGITAYLFFLGMLSLNLGIMNLLPIPVLDGGHLIFLAIEKLKGSPVPQKIQMRFYQIGALLLLSLMVIAVMSDIISF